MKMAGCCSTITYPLIRRLGRRDGAEPNPCESTALNINRRYSPIRVLNDDVLLNIFYLYQLADLYEYDNGTGTVIALPRHHWWYKLAHVCRLWRNIILESPSRLNLHLFCTNGVPVADMLAHSPPLPLILFYHSLGITVEDESGILLALSAYRDRVRQIYFWRSRYLRRFVAAMDDQFPILECLYIDSHSLDEVNLPVRFQAPNLRHLELSTASIPIGSPLYDTATGLVTLSLLNIPVSTHYPPSYILNPLSIMVQLERLSIGFESFLPNSHIEEHQWHWQTITLPNLQRFEFRGMSAYLESLVAPLSAPSLNTLQVYFANEPSESFTVPHLLKFIQAFRNLTFSSVQVTFEPLSVSLYVVPCDNPLMLKIWCRYLPSQVASAAQLFRSLSPILFVVEHVTISYQHERSPIPEWPNDSGDQIRWRELFRPFTNAKVIHVQGDLVGKIFRSLSSDDRAPPLRLLPNLEEVGYSEGSDVLPVDALTMFLNGRQVAGHPIGQRVLDPSVFDEHPAIYIY